MNIFKAQTYDKPERSVIQAYHAHNAANAVVTPRFDMKSSQSHSAYKFNDEYDRRPYAAAHKPILIGYQIMDRFHNKNGRAVNKKHPYRSMSDQVTLVNGDSRYTRPYYLHV